MSTVKTIENRRYTGKFLGKNNPASGNYDFPYAGYLTEFSAVHYLTRR